MKEKKYVSPEMTLLPFEAKGDVCGLSMNPDEVITTPKLHTVQVEEIQ